MRRKLSIIFVVTLVVIGFFVKTTLLGKVVFSKILATLSQPDIEYVRQYTWRHYSGFRVGEGDFMGFEGGFFCISGDTIFRKDKARVLILTTNDFWEEIKVISLDGEETGYYIRMDRHLRHY